MRPLPRLLLYVIAWIVTSVAISEITISLRGDWRPFSTPTAKVVEGPGGFAASVIMAEGFFGLLNGALYLLLLSTVRQRFPQDRNILLPSVLSAFVLGLICVGSWNGFLYVITGHVSHISVGQKIAVGVLPYIVSGAAAGCLRPQPAS